MPKPKRQIIGIIIDNLFIDFFDDGDESAFSTTKWNGSGEKNGGRVKLSKQHVVAAAAAAWKSISNVQQQFYSSPFPLPSHNFAAIQPASLPAYFPPNNTKSFSALLSENIKLGKHLLAQLEEATRETTQQYTTLAFDDDILCMSKERGSERVSENVQLTIMHDC